MEPTIITTLASKTLSLFNRRSQYDPNRANQYANPTRFIDSRLGGNPRGSDLVTLLREAADLVEQAQATPAVGGVDAEPIVRTLADVSAFLQRSQELLPKVECWVVYKVYRDKTETAWQDAAWCGCLDQAQAEALAAAIDAHYVKKHRADYGDRFVARLGTIGVRSMVEPGVTPEDYCRRIG